MYMRAVRDENCRRKRKFVWVGRELGVARASFDRLVHSPLFLRLELGIKQHQSLFGIFGRAGDGEHALASIVMWDFGNGNSTP